jgi:putative MATE family efflux protein
MEKRDIMEQMPIPRAVMSLAVPTVISSLVMVLYNLADTYFVGLLNSSVQTAAVTLAAPVLLAFNAVNNLFGVGASSMMSRALGRGEEHTAKQVSAFGFYGAAVCAVLFSLVYVALRQPLLTLLGADSQTRAATERYLTWTVAMGAAPAILNVVMAYLVRAEGATFHASIGTMSGCVLNIFLDPLFVLPWGLNLGAAGAGLATFLSNVAACGYFFVLCRVKRGRTCLCLQPAMARVDKGLVKGVCAVGVPACIQNLLNVTGMTVLNNFTAAYGAEAVAAMGIAQKVNTIPLYVVLGLSNGVTPLVGYTYAQSNVQRMRQAVVFAVKLGLGFLAVVTAGYFMGARALVRLFIENPAIVAYGTRLLRGMCLGLPFLAMDFIAVGVFQACGMGAKAFVFAVLRKIVLEIPAILVLNRLFPLYGLAYSQLCAEVVLSVAAVVSLHGIFQKLEQEDPRLRYP